MDLIAAGLIGILGTAIGACCTYLYSMKLAKYNKEFETEQRFFDAKMRITNLLNATYTRVINLLLSSTPAGGLLVYDNEWPKLIHLIDEISADEQYTIIKWLYDLQKIDTEYNGSTYSSQLIRETFPTHRCDEVWAIINKLKSIEP